MKTEGIKLRFKEEAIRSIAGFAALVAVSGPSALAVETACTAGLQLAGFARADRLNLYTED